MTPPPAAASARGRLTAEDVVDAAVGILQDFGMGDLSMRRVAAVLGVQASALYWHVPDKQTLLARVADRIVADPPGGPPWRSRCCCATGTARTWCSQRSRSASAAGRCTRS